MNDVLYAVFLIRLPVYLYLCVYVCQCADCSKDSMYDCSFWWSIVCLFLSYISCCFNLSFSPFNLIYFHVFFFSCNFISYSLTYVVTNQKKKKNSLVINEILILTNCSQITWMFIHNFCVPLSLELNILVMLFIAWFSFNQPTVHFLINNK